MVPAYPISPPIASECEGPDILFLLDRSQAILPDFYNNRFGIIEFSDDATVTVPLNHYNRADFFWKIQRNVSYGNGGDSNVVSALTLAYNEFVNHGSSLNGKYHIPRIIVLIVNDISRFGFNQTLAAMNKLKTIVGLPTGVIVPGLPGIPNGAQGRLANLTGNANYAFGSLDAAITGIPSLSNSTFTCPICGNLVFICEMTVAIGYDTKLLCLQLAQKLATATADNNKKQYAIALYGVEIYQDIEFQAFDKFNDTINKIIDNIEENNLPNGGQTFLAPILNQLYTTLNKNDTTSKADVFTLIVGELSAIRDPSPANTAAQNVAHMLSDVYVLDQSRYGPSSTIWTTLTNRYKDHIINGTTMTDIDSLFAAFEGTLLRDYNEIHC
uniref:VWFA domain-containing protein n=1 Tax=Panagrolaimus sp. ES5 TaxID=591445 RepID=A0AC34GXE7_9BILA